MIDLRQIRVVESEYRQFCRQREQRRQFWGLVLFCAAVIGLTVAVIAVVSS